MAEVVMLEGVQADPDLRWTEGERLTIFAALQQDVGILDGNVMHWRLLAILTVETSPRAIQG